MLFASKRLSLEANLLKIATKRRSLVFVLPIYALTEIA